MSAGNKAVILASRPDGMVSPDNFNVVDYDEASPVSPESPVRINLEYISVDPYMVCLLCLFSLFNVLFGHVIVT